MLNLSPKELQAIATIRGIKGYKSMPEDKLLSTLKASESENNFDKMRLKQIREYKFSKSEIKEIWRFIGNTIADKITSVSVELHPKKSKELSLNEANNEIQKERYTPPKDNKLLMN